MLGLYTDVEQRNQCNHANGATVEMDLDWRKMRNLVRFHLCVCVLVCARYALRMRTALLTVVKHSPLPLWNLLVQQIFIHLWYQKYQVKAWTWWWVYSRRDSIIKQRDSALLHNIVSWNRGEMVETALTIQKRWIGSLMQILEHTYGGEGREYGCRSSTDTSRLDSG
jgi:hypothetical protein